MDDEEGTKKRRKAEVEDQDDNVERKPKIMRSEVKEAGDRVVATEENGKVEAKAAKKNSRVKINQDSASEESELNTSSEIIDEEIIGDIEVLPEDKDEQILEEEVCEEEEIEGVEEEEIEDEDEIVIVEGYEEEEEEEGEVEEEQSEGDLPNGFLVASNMEEIEAEDEDPDVAMKSYQLFCSELITLIKEMDEKKEKQLKEGTEEKMEYEKNNQEVEIEGSLYTMQMRQLNRVEKIRIKNMRDCLNKAKQQVDALQLQLENSLCEILHVRKEVDKCLHFKSRDQNIELVPVDQFFEEAPNSLTSPEIREDNHKLRLARLKWELEKRQELALYYEDLLIKRKNVTGAIQEKKSDMENLIPLAKDVLDVTKPMQTYLGLSDSQTYGTNEAASLLPQPLYHLYMQTDAYRVACDNKMTVTINGDEEQAKRLGSGLSKVSSDEDSDSEKISSIRKKEMQRELLNKHPLSIQIIVSSKGGGDYIVLDFFYLTNLNVLAVVPNLKLLEPVTSSVANAVLTNEKILCELFSGDTGLESPNIVNHYQLRQVGLEKFESKHLGHPYVWVQRLGGLDFAGNEGKDGCLKPSRDIILSTIPNVIKQVRNRIKTSLALATQLISLENGTVPKPENMNGIELICKLKCWENLSWDDYHKYDCTSQLRENYFVSVCDVFYRATFVRGEARMIAMVALKSCYPQIAPLFSIVIEWNDEVHTSLKNDNIKDFESEINVYWKELIPEEEFSRVWNCLLLTQVYRAMLCFDIFLECEYPEHFPSQKSFLNPYRREDNKAHPYKYVFPKDVFTQR